MAEFERARSEAQKAQRRADIKQAADALFAAEPYHAISMSTIAARLGWTRTKLYHYMATKEEIYLELCADKRAAYFGALLAACPEAVPLTPPRLAEIWAAVLCDHLDFLRYFDILLTILETNVTVARLAAFKTAYYHDAGILCARLACVLGPDGTDSAALLRLLPGIHHYAAGVCCGCAENPLVQEALALAGLTPPATDMKAELQDFLTMTLTWHRR